MFGQPLDCFGAFLYGQHLHGIRLDLGYLFGIIGFDKFAQDIYELSDKLFLSVCCRVISVTKGRVELDNNQ